MVSGRKRLLLTTGHLPLASMRMTRDELEYSISQYLDGTLDPLAQATLEDALASAKAKLEVTTPELAAAQSEWESKSAKPLVRFEGLPGEFSQHDFGQVEVEFLNGARQRIHFFASRLKYSRLVRISLVKDETVESLVRTLAEHLASWGGRPLLCVFDRPKTIALKRSDPLIETTSVPRIGKPEPLEIQMVAEFVANRAQECTERRDLFAHRCPHPHSDQHALGSVIPEKFARPMFANT